MKKKKKKKQEITSGSFTTLGPVHNILAPHDAEIGEASRELLRPVMCHELDAVIVQLDAKGVAHTPYLVQVPLIDGLVVAAALEVLLDQIDELGGLLAQDQDVVLELVEGALDVRVERGDLFD
jgi:hypothetical protein